MIEDIGCCLQTNETIGYCLNCAGKYRQLARWLTELKTWRENSRHKKGHWIQQKGGGYCCSECDHYSLHELDGNFIHVSARTKYCHNCGAKMEGGVQNDVR